MLATLAADSAQIQKNKYSVFVYSVSEHTLSWSKTLCMLYINRRVNCVFYSFQKFLNVFISDSKTVLQCIGKENVIVPCVASLRSEDGECVYWSVALLHEFAINGKALLGC